MNTIGQLTEYAIRELKDTYNSYEVRSLCRIIFYDLLQYTNIDIHIKKNEILSESFAEKFTEIVRQLKTDRPIQYILGKTEFSGLTFQVNSATLIPRPETEELVLWVKEVLKPGHKLLDIGTGSGCIAISLAVLCPGTDIEGIDISSEAIRIAKQNAAFHQVEVNFHTADILHPGIYSGPEYDLLVSNPPYVRMSEKKEMHSRVTNFEPHTALFVPDTDPLLFYRQIALFGQEHLKTGGSLFFEINEALGQEMLHLLNNIGYTDTELKKDIFEKDRFVKAKKK